MRSILHANEITPSPHAHEREALAYLRENLPDHDPYRAWTNFEFVASDGNLYEVDALVVTPKGKTETARRLARSVYMLDAPAVRAIAQAEHSVVLQDARPVLIDEWQRVAEMWDFVRRGVDAGAGAGSYLLTGSASVEGVATQSGAGRIASLRMRPMTLSERGVGNPAVSLSETADVSQRLASLQASDVAGPVTAEAIDLLPLLFGDRDAEGRTLA